MTHRVTSIHTTTVFRHLQRSSALDEHTEKRIERAFHRFTSVTSAEVCFEDVNGPKGGLDKFVTLELKGPHLRDVRASAVASDVYEALAMAIERGQALIRRLHSKRTRHARTRREELPAPAEPSFEHWATRT